MVDAIKFSNQAYHDGDPKYYRLPGALDLAQIGQYATDAKEQKNSFNAFLDSTKRFTRVSVQMADIGSLRVKELVAELKPRIDSVFNYDRESAQWLAEADKYSVTVTGNSVMFLKGNDFLVKNLLESVLLAVIIISIVLYTFCLLYTSDAADE